MAALRGLPTWQREAVVLRYYAGLSEDQIAAAMGIRSPAVICLNTISSMAPVKLGRNAARSRQRRLDGISS
jgi:hypothetical protein